MNIVLFLNIIFPAAYLLMFHTSLTDQYALLLILLFGLNIVVQIILAVLTQPMKKKWLHISVTGIKAISFIALPLEFLSDNLRVVLLGIIAIASFLQVRICDDSASLAKITESDAEKAKQIYLSIACGSFCTAALVIDSIIGSIVLLLLIMRITLKYEQKSSKRYVIEILLAFCARLFRYFDILTSDLYLIIVILIVLLTTYYNFKMSDESSK